jgi:hypothetical protein
MKRDFNKIRNILLKFDESESNMIEIKAKDDDTYYFSLMDSSNLISSSYVMGEKFTYQLQLANEGQIFLELCRNQMIWDKVDTRIQECGFESVPYEILKEVLYDQIKKELMG